MIVLRKMRPDEFPAYCDYFIEDYSQEIALNYERSIEDAVALAEQDLSKNLPNGVESQNQELLCLEASINNQTTLIGYLWHSINVEDETAFICDFYIGELYRGKQYGKHAMIELEARLKYNGIHHIKLRVAFHNKRAFALYAKLGFVVTGYNMSKNIIQSGGELIMSTNSESDQVIKSPCIRHCCLDVDDVCVGCYRTITEIMDWQKSTQTEKLDILANCSIRKQKHDSLYP